MWTLGRNTYIPPINTWFLSLSEDPPPSPQDIFIGSELCQIVFAKVVRSIPCVAEILFGHIYSQKNTPVRIPFMVI